MFSIDGAEFGTNIGADKANAMGQGEWRKI